MLIELQADQLRDALGKVLSVVERKNTRPILTFCLIKANENELEIVGSDLEVSTKIIIPAHVENPGSFCISAKNIFDILRELPNEKISLNIDNAKSILKLVCNQIKYSLLQVLQHYILLSKCTSKRQ